MRIHGFHAQEALQDISRKANVVIGLEEVIYKTDGQISFDFAGGTVADLLNAFVAQAPDYQWQNDDGTIHVFRNGTHVTLADVVLDYPGTPDEIRRELWQDILRRPEYRAWMSSNRCHPLVQVHPMDFKFHEGDISIPAGQITIAQFLDQVATKSHANFWAVLQSEPSEPSCFASVILWPAPPTAPK